MKYKYHIFFLLLLSYSTLSAQFRGSGTTPFSFLQLPMSARLNSLGAHNVSIADGNISMALNNPALLTSETHMSINTNFAYLMGNTFLASAIYGHNFGKKKIESKNIENPVSPFLNRFAIGIHYLNYGQMRYTDEHGNLIGGDFSAHDMLLNIIYCRPIIDNLSVGVAIKHVYSAFEKYSSFALGADIGVYYQIRDSSLQMGVALQNIGWQLKKFYKDGLPLSVLPINLQFGITYRIKHAPLRFSLTFHNLQKWKLDYQTTNIAFKDLQDDPSIGKIKGVDMAFRHTIFCLDIIPRSEKFYLTLSYNHRRRAELNLKDQKSLAGFSLGAGLKLKKFRIDLALSQLVKSNFSFHVGLSLDLKSLLK